MPILQTKWVRVRVFLVFIFLYKDLTVFCLSIREEVGARENRFQPLRFWVARLEYPACQITARRGISNFSSGGVKSEIQIRLSRNVSITLESMPLRVETSRERPKSTPS